MDLAKEAKGIWEMQRLGEGYQELQTSGEGERS